MSRIVHHRPRYDDPKGEFKKSYHLEMVTDQQRTGAIFRALRRSLTPDAVFCELGCGTGIFSIFAASRCKKVYAVELDPALYKVAKRNIEASPYCDKIELIHEDAARVTLPHKVDVIFCEMMSIWCVEEPQIPVFNHAYQHLLKPGGLFLPTRIVNMAELGFFHFKIQDIEIKASMPLFTGIPRTGIMTSRSACKTLDFSAPVDEDLSCESRFECFGEGTLNCAKLTSIVQMGPQTIFSGSDSLMPLTVVPLAEPLTVTHGDKIHFQAKVHARMDLNEAVFSATKVSR